MIRLRRESKPVFLKNKNDESDAKGIWIGGDHPIVVQTMTTTDTADADATLAQIYGLAMEGAEVVRVTVKDPPDAAAMPAIVQRSPVPIVADIHFDYKLALNILGLVIFAALFWLTRRRGATDPVCGMKVDRLKALRSDHMGGAYFFCSSGCLEAFEREPERYAGHAAGATHGPAPSGA